MVGRWGARLVLQVALAALVVGARACAVLWSGPVLMPDTERYRDVADRLAPFEVWEGHGPGVLLQAVYLLPADAAVVVQTVLAGACWAVAAVYLAGAVTRSSWSWVVFATVTAWSLSPWFLVWDDWLMTEAVTCGGCALAAAGLGSWARGRGGGLLLGLVGVSIAVLARPFVAALLVPLLLMTAWPVARAGGRRVGAALAAAALLGGFAAWQTIALARVDALPYSYTPQPESLAAVQATDRLAGRGDVPGYLDLARQHGMPPCPAAEAVVTGPDDVFERVEALRAITACPDLDTWLDDGGLSWTAELGENTSNTAKELVDPDSWLSDSFNHYIYASPRTLKPRSWARARWPDVVRAVNGAMLLSTLVAVVVGLARARGGRLLVATATTWTAMFVVVSWAVDGMEYWRHLLPAFPALTILCAALVLTSSVGEAHES